MLVTLQQTVTVPFAGVYAAKDFSTAGMPEKEETNGMTKISFLSKLIENIIRNIKFSFPSFC